jgi:hypothetical protein
VQTKNDSLLVDFDREVLAERMQGHLAASDSSFDSACLHPYVVAPFDRRWIYYDRRLLGRPRWPVMRYLVQPQPNLALVFMRQSTALDSYDHALVVDTLASDRVFYSRRGAPFVAPLWRLAGDQGPGIGDWSDNLSATWKAACADRLGFLPDSAQLFAYVYAVLHAPAYRRDWLSELQCDFPRIPWPAAANAFQALVGLGQRLIDLHLSPPQTVTPAIVVGQTNELTVARGYPKLGGGELQLSAGTAIAGDASEAWNFHVGGYRVIERWLKSRQDRKLSASDLQYLTWLTEVARQTRQISAEIDSHYLAAVQSPLSPVL